MNKLASWWKRSPTVRMVARAGATAVAAYVATCFKAGTPLDWKAGAIAGGTAIGYAILGLLTPVEPHVGANKARVEPPA